MAELSKIRKNGVDYDLKDTMARQWAKLGSQAIGKKIASGEYKSILLLGDSITDGAGGTGYNGAGYTGSTDQELSTNTEGYCWANVFKKLIEETYSGVTVENCGAYGSVLSTQQVIFKAKVESGNYDLIVFLTGTNNRNAEYLYSHYKANLADTIGWMQKYSDVLVMNNIPARSDDGADKPYNMFDIANVVVGVSDVPDYYANLYMKFVDYCRQNNISLEVGSSVFKDSVHPNDNGYHIMFRLICDIMGVPLSAHTDYTVSGTWWRGADPVDASVMAAKIGWYNTEASGAEMNTITKVKFVPRYLASGNEDASWACDVNGNGEIMAYRTGTEVTIAPTTGATKIRLNADSSFMFAAMNSSVEGDFSALTEVSGTEMWEASANTNMAGVVRGTQITDPISVPDGINNLFYAFTNCKNLTEPPVLPNTVTNLANAFLGCSALSYIPQIPTGATSLYYAFSGCTSATSMDGIVIPEGVTNMEGAFANAVKADGTVTVNAQNVTNYTGAFSNVGIDTNNGVVLTGSCPILAELAASAGANGKVTVAT